MKTKIIFFFALFFLLWFHFTHAASLANNISVTGTTLADTTWNGYGWKLIFPNINWVKIITHSFALNPADISWPGTGNMGITWNFWLQNLSDTTDAQLWWATFDIWTVSGAPTVILQNNSNNTFTFSWYARSNASGWIYFWDTWVTNGKVIYNRTTWVINWCAFSQNIWWVCIDDFVLDTTPPDFNAEPWLSFKKPFSADNTKTMTTPESISQVKIENWNSISQTTYTTNNFTHDFRTVKDYFLQITDTTGNISDASTIKVVAGNPVTTLNPNHIIWVTEASSYSGTYLIEKKWDGNHKHTIGFILKDTYWNIVKNESWIKDVKVWVTFDNSVDMDQVLDADMWDAIWYSNNPFSMVNWYGNTGTGYDSNGNYTIDVASKAPTYAWYTETTVNNDIKLTALNIKITALSWNSWVWEANIPNLFTSNYWNKNFKFTPAVEIITLSNDRSFKLLRDIETFFTGSIRIDKSAGSDNILDINISHRLDIMSGSMNKNDNLSFQNIAETNGSQICIWYLKPNITNTSSNYYKTNTDCNSSSNTSNIIKSYSGPYVLSTSITDWFKATPKVVIWGLSKFDIKYNSEISYKLGSSDIKYNSLSQSNTNSITNREIKVTGITHKSDKNLSVISDSSIHYIWKLDKMTVYTQIKKNVAAYRKVWVGSKKVQYFTTNQTLNSWPSWIDTIIVDGADIIIWADILKIVWEVKSIIALKKWTIWWKIWIKNNVQFIWAVLVTDRSILSWNGTDYYSDTTNALKQLFIKGSILSYNTIGWSSSAIPKCPFYITGTCNEQIAKRYDFNHMRSFVNWETWNTSVNGTTYWVDMWKIWYADAPIIVEYDGEVQSKMSQIFSIN